MLTTAISNQTISISSLNPSAGSTSVQSPTPGRVQAPVDQMSLMSRSNSVVPTVSTVFKSDPASSAMTTTSATSNKTHSVKEFLNNTLPQPQPFSMEYLGKRMFTGVVFGVVGSAVTSAINISTGNWSGGQAAQFMLRDAIKGAVGGGGFGLGMGLTTMAFSRMGVVGLPLTVASIVGGSSVSILSVMGVSKAFDQWSW